MMADTATSLPLQQFISSLDNTCLPRILQVCSGVYFQGSVYEISGSEVSFSTGDLVKVIDIELISVTCKYVSNNEKFELPIDHKGLFKAIPERPYRTLEEMISLRLDTCLPFSFLSRRQLTVDALVVAEGTVITALSLEPGDGGHLHCLVIGHCKPSLRVVLPLSCKGEFYKYQSKERYTLREIASSPQLCSGRFSLENGTMSHRPLILCPVYEIKALMHLRRHIVRFPSSLEVDVVDVTDHFQDEPFQTPHTLTEVLSMPEDTFPAMVIILEAPESRHLPCSGWVGELRKDQLLILHEKGSSATFLFSSTKTRGARQYFVVSEQYKGRFRRRPREFWSVFEMYMAVSQAPGLTVTVMRQSEQGEEGVPALYMGDQLEVLRCHTIVQAVVGDQPHQQKVEALVCRHFEELTDNDEDEGLQREELVLPLHMQGHFMEKITDNKKYKIKDLCKDLTLPLNVKVASRDSDLPSDPLFGIPSLQLENVAEEPVIQASFPCSPELRFLIPARCLSMTVSFTQHSLPWTTGEHLTCTLSTVTEVTESFYHDLSRLTNCQQPPPPRPPRRRPSSSLKATSKRTKTTAPQCRLCRDAPPLSPGGATLEDRLGNLALTCKTRPPRPLPQCCHEPGDTDHDY